MKEVRSILFRKRVKMKKSSSSKELLIDWLRTALDYQSYPGLAWSDRHEGVFYVKWVHKSSEQWSGDDLAPFRAWAAHKGKLDGKNPKQLKATFRCALNSKKELKEHHRDRERRYWQFVDPNTVEGEKDKTPKKKRKTNKASGSCVDNAVTVSYSKDIKGTSDDEIFPRRKISSTSEDEMARPTTFPAYSNFEPLTPPNENSYMIPDLKFSREQMNEVGKCGLNSTDVGHISASIPSMNVNNSLVDHYNKACTVLPPFETFGSFRNITPPPQKNEVCFISTEYISNYTPPPDHNRLTPPKKFYREPSNDINEDVYQPNCWSNCNGDKEQRNVCEFFSSDFIGLYKSSTQEPDHNNSMDYSTEMDQYVPATNTSINLQFHAKIEPPMPVNRVPSSNLVQTENFLDRFDFCMVDEEYTEECRRLMQEIEIIPS